MSHSFNSKNPVTPRKSNTCKLPFRTNIFVYMLVFFVAVAVMQALQLSTMRSEAKSLDHDIIGIRAEQTILHEQYSFYNNNLSYYLKN